jgi:hypothetical protein
MVKSNLGKGKPHLYLGIQLNYIENNVHLGGVFFGATTISTMTHSITTLYHYAEYRVLFVLILSVVRLNVITLCRSAHFFR